MSNEPRFLATADAIACRLARDAVWHGARCSWTGDSMEHIGGTWQVAHRALGGDLYGGTAGVALFLARMHRATGERLFARVARAALEQACAQVPGMQGGGRGGLYTGATGVSWALLRAAEWIDTPEFAERGAALLAILQEEPVDAQALDFTAGHAGAIAALLDLRSDADTLGLDSGRLIDFARRHGDRLIEQATRSERGWHWPAPGAPAGSPGLCGLSHGAAGIAWALAALHASTGDSRYQSAAAEALRYERSWFDQGEQNWPDLRSLYDPTLGGDGKRLVYMAAWCHGAPGIGLARLATHALTREEASAAEARAALRCTCAGLRAALAGTSASFCLCHGLAGNAELLIEASRVFDEPDHLALARQVGQLGLALYAEPGAPWPCGVLGGGETPGLMLGLAGIGSFYLRLHDPTQPSMLLFGPQARLSK